MIAINSSKISAMEKMYRTNLINSIAGYKSLNLVGTLSNEANTNLCIVSSVFHMGSNPPLLGMVMRPQRENNETLTNIKSSGQYTLNNVLPAWYKQAHQTSASYAAGVSEFKECGFKATYVQGFKAPFVAESSVKIGLEMREMIEVELNGTTIIIGEILHIMIDEPLLEKDGTVDHVKGESMTVAGLDTYCIAQKVSRLSYAKPYTVLQEI